MTIAQDEPLYLALDQGGHATRAIVFDARGQAVCSATQDIATLRGEPDRVEHSALEVAASLKTAIAGAVESLGKRRAGDIVAVGLATQRSSIVCWDRSSGDPLSPVLSWQDTRAAARLSELKKDRRDIRQRTGLFPSAHYGASKLEWCLQHIDDVKQAAVDNRLAMGPLASFLATQLCGPDGFVVDPGNAGRTMLWDIRTQDWSAQLLGLFGIDRTWLPRCVPTVGRFGRVLEVPGTPYLAAMNGDQSAALFADGLPREGDVYINAGTGAFVQKVQTTFPRAAERLPVSVALANGACVLYALEGTVNGAASALELFARDEGLAHWRQFAQEWLSRIDSPPLYLNGVGGLGSPFWLPQFRSRFVGEGNPAERWVAIVESIVFLICANLEQMADESSARRIVASGGLATMDGFCQRLADLSQMAVIRPANKEATARGIACLLRPNYAWQSAATVGHDTTFEPQDNSALLARYVAWRGLMPTLADE